MPHYLGNILVVTKDELIPKCYNTYDALRMALKRYEDLSYGIKRAMLGGNGRKLLIAFDSLSAKHQDAIGDPRKQKHPLEDFYKEDSVAYRFFNEFQYPDGSYLIDDTIEKLIINASVLTALVKLESAREEMRIKMNQSTRGIADTLYRDAHAFNAILAKRSLGNVQHTLNGSLRRFKQQFKKFKEDSYVSLIKDSKGRSKKNAVKIDLQHEKLLNNLFAGRETKPNATEVAREYEGFLNGYVDVVNEFTGEIYNPKEFKKISESAITNYLRSYESKVGTHAKRSADRQVLMQNFIPYHSMERPAFAGSIISIDDRQPPFEYEKGKRMWWYIGIDVASEAIVAWAYGKSKDELIINFYRNMVSNHHNFGVKMPHELECESSLNSSFKKTFLKEGAMFQKVNIHANSARSKIIERFFGHIRYEMEKEHVGWIGRPFSRRESNQTDKTKKIIVPYDKLVQQCFADIVKWNNMPKKGTNIGRFDFFMQNQNPSLEKTNYRGFVKHLGTKTQTSCNAGIMLMQRQEWLLGDKSKISSGEELIKLLKQVEGKDIDIYRLDDDQGNVIKALIYDKDDRFIGEALPKPKAARASIEETEIHKNARTILSKYSNTVTAYMQLKKNEIDSIIVINNMPKTVSSSFTIPGLNTFKPRTQQAKKLANNDDDDEGYNYKPKSHKPTGLINQMLN